MSSRERKLALVVAIVAGVFIGWKLIASPVKNKLAELRERAETARSTIEAETAVSERAETILAKDAQFFRVKDLADVGTVEASFLELVNRAAEESGVKVASERPSNSTRPARAGRPSYSEIQVALTGTAALDAFVKFLDRFAGDQRPLRVVAVSMSRTDTSGTLAINIRLSTVVMRESPK